MKKKIILSIVSFLLIGAITACNGSIRLDLPTMSPKSNTELPEETGLTAITSESENLPNFNSLVLADLQTEYENIYHKVIPSVVSISVTQTLRQTMPEIPSIPGFPFNFDDDSGTTPEYQTRGAGSGFVWDQNGHIVTNNHVVEGADTIRVVFSDSTSVLGEVIGKDADSDLAVVKVSAPSGLLEPIEVADSTKVKVGQIAIAIGNPFQLSGSMTTGIISGTGRSLALDTLDASGLSYTIPDVIQTDAAINPGNSGGVLVDIQGRLIGVTTAIESPVRANAGIGYVVPSVIVQKVIPILIKDGKYEQPWIGISGIDMVPELAELMNLDSNQQGALVVEITANSPADKAGLIGSSVQAEVDGSEVRIGGDVIVSVNNQPVNDFEDLVAYLARYALVGQTIKLGVIRQGKIEKVSLTLAARPGQQKQEARRVQEESESGAWLGIQTVDVTPKIAEAMGLDNDSRGALVQQVTANSPADEAGIRGSYTPFDLNGRQILLGGDIIIAVESERVESTQDLSNLIRQNEPGDMVKMSIIREGKTIEIQVTLAEKPSN